VFVDTRVEVVPGIFIIPTVSNVKGTLELRELTLAIESPLGLVLVAGCSHPGVEENSQRGFRRGFPRVPGSRGSPSGENAQF
jgi:metal-dependent hydrolase (beta-lactamase superfamily II)